MRILEGVGTIIQLGGLLARLCKMVRFDRWMPCSLLLNECNVEHAAYIVSIVVLVVPSVFAITLLPGRLEPLS
jgi:hypothetical protein